MYEKQTNLLPPRNGSADGRADEGYHRIHSYFTGSPCHPDGQRVLYTRLRNLSDPADICLWDRCSQKETVIGQARNVWFHSGARAWFVSQGRKVMYQSHQNWTAQEAESPGNEVRTVDLVSGEESVFNGSIINYSRNIGEWYIEVDANYPVERQSEMGVYLRRNDGTEKRRLASVKELLAAHPHGKSMRDSALLFRLGGAISPDETKVLLFLITRAGTFVRDYFVIDMDGANLTFHGRLGGHVCWHPDGRHILSFADPNGCSWFPKLREASNRRGGYLAQYDIVDRELRLLSEQPMIGNCHVSPAPDGRRVVIDCHTEDRVDICIFDYEDSTLRMLCSEPHVELIKTAGTERMSLPNGRKHYNTHAHAVFSPDSRHILYNSCTDGWVGIAELKA